MRCLMCGKRIGADDLFDLLLSEDVLCRACRAEWERTPGSFRFCGLRAEAPWLYDDAFSSCLLQYKEAGDEALGDVFLWPVRRRLARRWRGWTLLLMPGTEEKRRQRGFSHLRGMFACLGLKMEEPFLLKEEFSQKNRTPAERRKMTDNIVLKPGVRLPGKVLLCDDTITTGSTVRGAYAALPPGLQVGILCASANVKWFGKRRNNERK